MNRIFKNKSSTARSELIIFFHEILNARKYKNINKFSFFSGSDKPRMLFVGILTFMSRKNFMPSSVEHGLFFITSGPD